MVPHPAQEASAMKWPNAMGDPRVHALAAHLRAL
jgi:hypothetical protein